MINNKAASFNNVPSPIMNTLILPYLNGEDLLVMQRVSRKHYRAIQDTKHLWTQSVKEVVVNHLEFSWESITKQKEFQTLNHKKIFKSFSLEYADFVRTFQKGVLLWVCNIPAGLGGFLSLLQFNGLYRLVKSTSFHNCLGGISSELKELYNEMSIECSSRYVFQTRICNQYFELYPDCDSKSNSDSNSVFWINSSAIALIAGLIITNYIAFYKRKKWSHITNLIGGSIVVVCGNFLVTTATTAAVAGKCLLAGGSCLTLYGMEIPTLRKIVNVKNSACSLLKETSDKVGLSYIMKPVGHGLKYVSDKAGITCLANKINSVSISIFTFFKKNYFRE